MAGFFTTGGGKALGGLIGGLAGAVNPYLGGAVQGALGGFTSYQEQKQAERAFKKMSKGERATTRALPKAERRQKLLGLPSNLVAPVATTALAMVKKTTPNISAGFVGGLGGVGVGIAEELAKWTGGKTEKIIAKKPPPKTMFPPAELEQMTKAIDIRTQGTRALIRPPTMSNGGNLAVLKRLLVGGVTRAEAQLIPGGGQWYYPRGVGIKRFGPGGEAYDYPRRRRMNPLNPKALRRSMSRVKSFAKFAKSVMTFEKTHKMKKRRRR